MNEIAVGVSTGGTATTRAVQWAAEQAAARGISLRLVHVVDDAGSSAGADGELRRAAEDRARECLSDATAAASLVSDSIAIVTTLEHGDPVGVFERISEGAEMLVVGSDWHGGRRANRRRVHSLRIAAASRAPVAVIPDLEMRLRSGVVVGVDGSHASDHALAFAAGEAERLGSRLIAVHSWDVVALVGGEYGYGAPLLATDDLARAEAEILDASLEPVVAAHPLLEIERRVVAGDPVQELSGAAAEAELLVVGSHGRGALARFLLGSVSHGVLAELEAPTVVIR
ncbi:universal stress protein [Agromyces badenianii]|uniref:universal stress protein n=1 Tax=Agromyces badenianii TaxID=2080742 RepID=UPI000D59E915|nr:universal stress protein [Agromyces badenianii]PWC04878.1 universal stress protein UspA [Agromyces badenianii]